MKWLHIIPDWWSGARARAKLRRTPWRLVLIPLVFACTTAVFLLIANLAMKAQVFFGPDDVFFCTPANLAIVVMFLSVMPVAASGGCVISNLLIWTISPIRRALEKAEAPVGQSFSKANAALIKFFVIAVLIVLPILAVAMNSRLCLSQTELYYKPHLLASLQTYSLAQVVVVRPRCMRRNRTERDIGLDLVMSDGATFDVANIWPWFSPSSERVWAALRGIPSDKSQVQADCPSNVRKHIAPHGGQNS